MIHILCVQSVEEFICYNSAQYSELFHLTVILVKLFEIDVSMSTVKYITSTSCVFEPTPRICNYKSSTDVTAGAPDLTSLVVGGVISS